MVFHVAAYARTLHAGVCAERTSHAGLATTAFVCIRGEDNKINTALRIHGCNFSTHAQPNTS